MKERAKPDEREMTKAHRMRRPKEKGTRGGRQSAQMKSRTKKTQARGGTTERISYMHEHTWRSALKGISWRILATADTVLLAFLFTGSITSALSIGGLELLTKTFLYFLHERAWLRVSKGLTRHADGNIRGDGHTRSIAKALTWRLVGALDTFIISFFVTGHITVSLYISGAEFLTKTVLYYVHERVWQKTSLGMRKIEFPLPPPTEEERLKKAFGLVTFVLAVCIAGWIFVMDYADTTHGETGSYCAPGKLIC